MIQLFNMVSNCIKWFTTSWTYSMSSKSCQYLYSQYAIKFRQDFLGSLYLKGLVQFSSYTWYIMMSQKLIKTLQNCHLINMYCMSKKSFPLLYSKYTVCQRPSKFLNKMDQSLLNIQ